jgi:iron complex outermembrane receptor protein
LGISQKIEEAAEFDLTYFYDDGEDRIVVSPPPPFPPVLENIGEFRTRGVEGTVTLFPISELSTFAGFTYLDAHPNDLPYTPKWTASAGTNYRFLEKYQISLDALFVDEQFVTSRARQEGTVNTDGVGSYFVLNGKLTYDFTLRNGTLKCQAYLAGENLTDTDYEQKKGYPMPGISSMVGFVIEF